MLNRRPCRGYSNIVLGRKIGGLAPEVMNLDYMTWPNPGSGCVRSAPYNRLLSSTAFLTRECFALEQKGAFATSRGRRALRRARWPWRGRADAESKGCGKAVS